MKKLLLALMLVSTPALAQQYTIHPTVTTTTTTTSPYTPTDAPQAPVAQSNTVPTIRTLSANPVPGSSTRIYQYSTTECGIPHELLNKNADVLKTMKFNQPVRILHFGEFKTMDFSAQRLNFGLDRNNIIRAISCG